MIHQAWLLLIFLIVVFGGIVLLAGGTIKQLFIIFGIMYLVQKVFIWWINIWENK